MSEKIKEIVKKTYTDAVTKDTDCCSTSCCGIIEEATFSESYSHIEGYEKDADYGLGCGIPTEFAKIKEGDTVLDLGSGAGNDVFVARSIVGDTGRVIGVDMTEAMVKRANENKEKLGHKNVEFLLGEIEELPIDDNTIDVAVSNCVMNLVPNKLRAYKEVKRVLKTQGHFSISDIVLSGELPKSILNVAEMYAGCVSGALTKTEYMETIKKAGFKKVAVVKERKMEIPDDIFLQYINEEELAEYKKNNAAVLSITVYAEK